MPWIYSVRINDHHLGQDWSLRNSHSTDRHHTCLTKPLGSLSEPFRSRYTISNFDKHVPCRILYISVARLQVVSAKHNKNPTSVCDPNGTKTRLGARQSTIIWPVRINARLRLSNIKTWKNVSGWRVGHLPLCKWSLCSCYRILMLQDLEIRFVLRWLEISG